MSRSLNQYAVYRLRYDRKETRVLRHQSYRYLQEHGLKICSDYYTQLYLSGFDPQLSPTELRRQLEKELPAGITGTALDTGDVLAVTKEGITRAYYVDSNSLVVLSGFFHVAASAEILSIGMSDCRIEGRPGLWLAAEEMWIDGHCFLLMQSQEFGRKAAYAVLDSYGRQAADDTEKGFSEETIGQIREFIQRQDVAAAPSAGQEEEPDAAKTSAQAKAPRQDMNSGKPEDGGPSSEYVRPHYTAENMPQEKNPPEEEFVSETKENGNKHSSSKRRRKRKKRKNGVLPMKGRESVLKRLRAYQEKLSGKQGKS